MAPLEDADKLGIISEREKAQLTAWQRYRVALYRLPQSEGWPTDVIWPDAPQ
ncbi:tail fiber assembly protein [Aeromonas veronii]